MNDIILKKDESSGIMTNDLVVKYVKEISCRKIFAKGTKGSGAFDIYSDEVVDILPGECTAITTGIALEIPEGYEMEISPRSSMFRKGIMISGKIDSDYRGWIWVLAFNMGKDVYRVNFGDRIAQGTFRKVESVAFVEVDRLNDTERGDGGFGSTGK